MEVGRGERSEEEQGKGEVQGWVEVQAEWEVQAEREDRKEEGDREGGGEGGAEGGEVQSPFFFMSTSVKRDKIFHHFSDKFFRFDQRKTLLCPDSSSPASSTLHSSTTSSAPHSSTSSRNLRSSYMSLPDTGRPGSAQHTLTRVHCPTAASSCWQHPFPSTSRNITSLPSVQHNNYY